MKIKENHLLFLAMLTLLYIFATYLYLYRASFYLGDYITISTTLFIMLIGFFTSLPITLWVTIGVLFTYAGTILMQSILGHSPLFYINPIFVIACPLLAIFTNIFGKNLNKMYKMHSEAQIALDSLVSVDIDTGFRNVKEFYKDLEAEMSKSKRHGDTLTLLILRLSYFDELEAINGQDVMKEIIGIVGRKMEDLTRISDNKYRINKDTFAMLLSHTDYDGAKIVKAKLKESLMEKGQDELDLPFETRVAINTYKQQDINPVEYKNLCEEELEYDV